MFIILAVTLVVSIFEHFRRGSKRTKSLTGKKEAKKKNYLEKLMIMYVKMYWSFVFFYQGLVLINNAGELKI